MPTGPAQHGRRDPELAAALTGGGIPVTVDVEAEHGQADGHPDDDTPTNSFLRVGDIVTLSVTLPVILPGDSKEAYFGAKHTTRALPGEDDTTLYARLAGNVISMVMAEIKDTVAAIEEELGEQTRVVNAR